jgi:hypothetical protein
MTVAFKIKPSLEGEISFNDPRAVVHYWFSGCSDDTAIYTVAGVDRFIRSYRYKEAGGGCWDVDVFYEKSPGSYELTFDTSGGSGKVLQSLETVDAFNCQIPSSVLPTANDIGVGVPDFKQAIGVTNDSVDGVDVPLPKFDFSINVRLKMSTLSAIYLKMLADMSGMTNSAAWTINWKGQAMTFATESVRFLGTPGKETSDDDLDITYKFSYSAPITATIYDPWDPGLTYGTGSLVSRYEINYVSINASNLGNDPATTVGTFWDLAPMPAGDVTIANSDSITKAGWHYIWVYYEKKPDTGTMRFINVPIAAYVERVSKTADFTLLAL